MTEPWFPVPIRRRIRLAWKYRRTIIGALRRRNWMQARIWLGCKPRASHSQPTDGVAD